MIPTGFKREIRGPAARYIVFLPRIHVAKYNTREVTRFVSLGARVPERLNDETLQPRVISLSLSLGTCASLFNSAGYERSLSKKEYSKNQAKLSSKLPFSPSPLPILYYFFDHVLFLAFNCTKRQAPLENLVSKMETRAHISSERTYNSVMLTFSVSLSLSLSLCLSLSFSLSLSLWCSVSKLIKKYARLSLARNLPHPIANDRLPPSRGRNLKTRAFFRDFQFLPMQSRNFVSPRWKLEWADGVERCFVFKLIHLTNLEIFKFNWNRSRNYVLTLG